MKWRELLKEVACWTDERLDQVVMIALEEEQVNAGGALREVMWTAEDAQTGRVFLLSGRKSYADKDFKVAHVSSTTNEHGLYEHIFIARDGTAWRAWAYRGPGGKTVEAGDVLSVPYEDGKPAFFRSGFHLAEPILSGVASEGTVLEVWGE